MVGAPGMGQRDLFARIAQRASVVRRPTISLWVTPGQPSLMFSLALCDRIGADEPVALDAMSVMRRIRLALREPEDDLQRAVILVHGIQDLADEDAAVLEALLCNPPSGEVLIVATASTRRADGRRWLGLAPLRAKAASEGRCEVLDLASLDTEQIAALVERTVGVGAAAPRFLRELEAKTRGYLDDLQDWLTSVTQSDPRIRLEVFQGSRGLETMPAPEGVIQRTREMLHGLSPEAAVVASAVTLWGRPAPLSVIQELTGLAIEACEHELLELLERGVVEAAVDTSPAAFEAPTPLVGLATAGEVPAFVAERIHRRAVDVLERSLRAPDEGGWAIGLADHYLRSGMPVTEAMVDCIEHSARTLIGHGRFADAREQLLSLQHALAQAGGTDAEGALLPPSLAALKAETLSRSGQLEAAQELLGTRTPAAPGDIRSTIRRARDQVALGHDLEAWKIYEPLVSGRNPARDASIIQARVESARVLQTLGWIDEAIHQSHLAYRESVRSENWRLAALAVLARYSIKVTCGRPYEGLRSARRAYRLARRSGNAAVIARATSAVGNALSETVSLPRGLRWVERAMRLAEASDDFPSLSWTGIRVAAGRIELGDLDMAERTALRTMHMDSALYRVRPLPRSHSLIRTVRALRGQEFDERGGTVAFWHGTERLDMLHALYQEAIARHTEQMLAGDSRGAYESVSTVVTWFIEASGRERFLLRDLIPRQVEAAVAMGDLDAAAAALAGFEKVRRSTEDFPMARAEYQMARGRLAAARGEWPRALKAFGAALAIFEEQGFLMRRATAQQEMAAAHLEGGDRSLVVPLLDEVHRVVLRAGTDRRPIQQLYRRAGRRAPRLRGEGALSEREQEVARLAAQGMTDAQIAVHLGISRRTATTHMHNILSKRGLRSRLELLDTDPAG